MILLLDIGNTRIKWALADDSGLHAHGGVAHGGDPAAALRQAALPPADATWAACVASVDRAAVAHALRAATGHDPQLPLTPARWDGLVNSYAEPARMGVDRWLAMVAAWTQVRGALCVVGAGSALTFDRVGADGRHRGGLIGPGLQSSQQSLLAITRGAAAAADAPYGNDLGRDTTSAVRQAAWFGCLGMIERGLRAPGAEAGEARFLTGGDAAVLQPALEGCWTLRPHLVLEGLRILALAQHAHV